MSDNLDDLQKELIKDFIIESLEGLERYDSELLAIENSESDENTLNNIFRVVHSIKGTAGCLGLHQIEKASHVGEDLMTLLREGQIDPSPDRISTLLALSDSIRTLLDNLENTGEEGDLPDPELLERLEHLATQPSLQFTDLANDIESPAEEEDDIETAFGLFGDDSENETGEALTQNDNSLPPDSNDEGAFGFFIEPEAPANTPSAHDTRSEPKSAIKAKGSNKSIAESSIRVDVAHLERVMNMVGELVLARNQILLNTVQFDEAALLAASQRLNIITTELQESVMKTRMQPIRTIWSKFPRITRDLASDLGKQVRLVMDGQDTELDRTIIEAIKDPLTHIIRNAIDHGIESPEQRLVANKPQEGLLTLRAYHEGGQVIIEIMDDGAGIDPDKVLAKAISKNLVSANESKRFNPRDIINLIFLPGFSTAETVSNVSGRGVGMDVVKTNIERIGGSIDLNTETGQGSIIKIKIPLTLAIIPALLVSCGGDRYAIPQVNLLELVRLDPEKTDDRIERIHDTPVYRLRGQLLPIIYLHEQLAISPKNSEEITNIIVLQADDRQFGLVVDEIKDTEEIVVKPLGKQLKNISSYAGATILGDGKVALILDALGLAQHAHVLSERATSKTNASSEYNEDALTDLQSILLFNVGGNRRMALPISHAARLEEFALSDVEESGSQLVIQYRGEILPLIDVAGKLSNCERRATGKEAQTLQVIVYSNDGYTIGLIVDSIIDIVESELIIKRSTKEKGILGSAIIQEKVTDLLDVKAIASHAIPQTASTC